MIVSLALMSNIAGWLRHDFPKFTSSMGSYHQARQQYRYENEYLPPFRYKQSQVWTGFFSEEDIDNGHK